MFFKCFKGIMRTSRSEAAFWAYPRGNDPLVYFDEKYKGKTKYLHQQFHQ